MYIVVEYCVSDWMNIMYDAIFGQRGQTSTGDTSGVSSLLKISPLPFPKHKMQHKMMIIRRKKCIHTSNSTLKHTTQSMDTINSSSRKET